MQNKHRSVWSQPLQWTRTQIAAAIVVGVLVVQGTILGTLGGIAQLRGQATPTNGLRLCISYPNAMFQPNGLDPITGVNYVVAIDLTDVTGDSRGCIPVAR